MENNMQNRTVHNAIPDIMNMSREQLRNTTVCYGEIEWDSVFTEIFGKIPSADEVARLEAIYAAHIELDTPQELLLEIKFGKSAASLADMINMGDFCSDYLLSTPVDVLNLDYRLYV